MTSCPKRLYVAGRGCNKRVEEKTMFDGTGWNDKREKELDNLAPATGAPVPIPPIVEYMTACARVWIQVWQPWWLRF